MAGLIPQSFIDDLLDRTDIAELVDSRVKLKKTGKNYSACCPFHDEKTPSFTVSPDKQFYYCFGCGASGNALGFLMEYERIGFIDAIEQLASRAGVEVPRTKRDPNQEAREKARLGIYRQLEKANQFYRQQLRQHPSREQAINYLKSRGLDGVIARDFGIGFAPEGWDNLLRELGEKPEDRQLLIDGGMLIERKDDDSKRKLYDRFRHRIMFPIHDLRGRVIGFGGRVLGDDKPKYLNSPETPVFHKGLELYGLYEALQHYRKLPRLLVVEGYMDVVSLAQFGIRYAVATLGTACGEEHLKRAFRHTSEVVFCFDGDNAGRAAARRALENTLPTMTDGRQVKFLFLPDGEDPDTLIRQIGADKFEHRVELAVPLEDFLFDTCAEGIDTTSLEGRARLSKQAVPLLDKLPQGVFRELMFDQLATRTGINRTTLDDLIALQPAATPPTKTAPASPNNTTASAPAHRSDKPTANSANTAAPAATTFTPAPPPVQPRPGNYLIPPAHKAIALLLSDPALANQCGRFATMIPAWSASGDKYLQLLGHLLKLLMQRPHYQISHLIGHWQARYGEREAKLLHQIAQSDLIQSARRMRCDDEDNTGYDPASALLETLDGLQHQQGLKRSQRSLSKLKQIDYASASREEIQKLVDQATGHKKKT